MHQTGKILIIIGIILIVVGIIVYFAGNKFSWFGRLPGDIRIERENFKFYFPVTTMIIISIILIIISKFLKRF
jgi:Protein of unknown function (DUF2905).